MMRYSKLLASLVSAGAVAGVVAIAIPARGTTPGKNGRISIPAHGTVSGKNGRILFQGNRGRGTQLFSIRPDGSGLVQVTHVPANQSVEDGAWSNDGTMIAYSLALHSHGRGEMARADGSNPHAITPRRFRFAGDPDWLPDGRRFVVSALSADPASHRKCDQGLRLVTTKGRLIRTITHITGTACKEEHWDVNADVSPDGKRIAFDASSPAGDAICVMRLNGSGRTCLTARADDAAHPTWSPDGAKILFQTHHDPERNRTGAAANLFSIRPDGSDLTQITHLSGDGFYAGAGAWSPDGSHIVYRRQTPDGTDLFVIDLTTGVAEVGFRRNDQERQLTHLGEQVHAALPDWGTNRG